MTQEVYQALLGRVGEGSPRTTLAPTRRVMDLLGDPQRAYPVIHVAGTNGKTTTSRIIESLLRSHGLRTGLLTSPHLERFNERIAIAGEPVTDEVLRDNWLDISPYLEMVDGELRDRTEQPLTFFEAVTVLAFAIFADVPVDVAVVETGMGGEWDSTNVADGAVAVFTPIDLDHTERLGETIDQIARTKSGIIKPAAQVVSAIQKAPAQDELVRATGLTESPFILESRDFTVTSTTPIPRGQSISVQGRAAEYRDLELPLFGFHQAHNAAVAIAAVESFIGGGNIPLSWEIIQEGLASVRSPGRLQIIGANPTIIVDTAHNPHGAESAAAGLWDFFRYTEVAVVLGTLRGKDAPGIVAALAPLANVLFIGEPDSDRALPAEELAGIAAGTDVEDIRVIPQMSSAVLAARQWATQQAGRIVLVTGSIAGVAEAVTLAKTEGWSRVAD